MHTRKINRQSRSYGRRYEHWTDFGIRLQLLRSNVVQRVSNDTTLEQKEKLCHISHYDKTALNTFIAGCSGTLKNNMYLRKPASLEDAMAYVNEFENFERLHGNCSDNKSQFSKCTFVNNNVKQAISQNFKPNQFTQPNFCPEASETQEI